jgi:hypothetical protein
MFCLWQISGRRTDAVFIPHYVPCNSVERLTFSRVCLQLFPCKFSKRMRGGDEFQRNTSSVLRILLLMKNSSRAGVVFRSVQYERLICRFTWTCHDFGPPERRDKRCLVNQTSADVPASYYAGSRGGASILRFNKALLHRNVSNYLFTLTVWKTDRLRVNTTQLITIKSQQAVVE